MAHLEPAEALQTCERLLRQLLAYVFREKYGPDWVDKVANNTLKKKWASYAQTEAAERGSRGPVVPTDPLEYSDLQDLMVMMGKEWPALEPALGERAELMTLLERFKPMRNPTAHSRQLVPFERDLLAGIAGQLQNQVTRFMTSQSISGEYFPRITSASDNMGHAATATELAEAEGHVHVTTGRTLHVGDRVILETSGVDPDGRELEWAITNVGTYSFSLARDFQVGPQASLTWVWEAGQNSPDAHLRVLLRARGAEHLRFGEDTCDFYVDFKYGVLPPRRG